MMHAQSLAAATGQFTATFRSSISTAGGDPVRIAADDTGVLYVAASCAGKVHKYYQDGSFAGSINGFAKPVSVAVDSSHRVYVGDFIEKSVRVVNPDGQTLFSLGKGKGEFGMPGAIAIASNGSVYVTDSFSNVVKVYGSDGAYQFSFGGYGTNPGQMIFPTGITSDDANQEIYVVDYTNGRVEVFGLDGTFKRSFGSFGSGQGKLTRPQGIHVSAGRVYVADSYQSAIEVFDTSGTFLAFAGQFGTGDGSLKIPMDVTTIGTNLFVSNTDNRRVEVFDIVDPQGLTITPLALAFSAFQNSNPSPQTIQVNPEVAGGQIPWTTTVSSPFNIGIDQTSGTTPSVVTVTPNTAGLIAGTYTGLITFSANGVSYPVNVTVIVQQPLPQLFVSPGSISFSHQKDGDTASTSLSVTSTNGALQWTATSTAQWLDLSAPSGTTPGTLNVALNQNANSLAEGTYTATVTVTAPGAVGSPADIEVKLSVLVAGTIVVNTNLENASFAISGPEALSGSGISWTEADVAAGTYTIQFDFVKGYRKPATRSFEVKTGKTTTIDVMYQTMKTANVIVAAKGPAQNNDDLVRVLDQTGAPITEFHAFPRPRITAKYGAKVVMADIDNDGTSEIIAVPGEGLGNQAAINVFRQDGTPLSSLKPISGTSYGAGIAAGDILGDGQYEVAMSMVTMSKSARTTVAVNTVVIYQFSGFALTEKARFDISSAPVVRGPAPMPANLAFGDLNGDGVLELIVSLSGEISVYAFDDTLGATLLTSASGLVPGPAQSRLTVSSGDTDGDGLDEVIVGYTDGVDSYAAFFDADLKIKGSAVRMFQKERTAPNLSSMDWTGDGTAEVLAGQGPEWGNDSTLRVYDLQGTVLKEIRAFDASVKYGVNAALGVKE